MTTNSGISFFEKYLSLWVALCIIVGTGIGVVFPAAPKLLSKMEYAHVSIPVAALIWLMIYPMMLKVDFSSIVHSVRQPKGLVLTFIVNWMVKPFTMFGLAYFFFHIVFRGFITPENAQNYLAGAVILAAAPCTAMVFVWSHLTKGNPSYTLVQVAINDLLILVLFTPIVAFLLGLGNISIPYDTLILSIILFVVIPLSAGFLSRFIITRHRGKDFFENKFIPKFGNITIIGLLLTLIIIFSFQGETILQSPLSIALIAVPIIIQTLSMFSLVYFIGRLIRLKHSIACPAAMIGGSNFFELAVAVAVSLFGLKSGATLATVVGVLVEVPVMLALVKFANRTGRWYNALQ